MDEERLTYVLEAVDSVSPVLDEIKSGQEELGTETEKTTGSLDGLTESQDNVAASTQTAQEAVDSQSISFIKNMTAVTGLHRGLGMLTRSSEELGLINEDTAKSFEMINAAVGMVSGSFMMLRSAQEIVTALKESELGLAAVETFRSVLNNPASIALVGAGIGVAAGVGGMLLMGGGGGGESSGTKVNQTVIFGSGSSSDQQSTARSSFEAMGGF